MRSYLEEVDFEKIKLRFDAFWQKEIIDRPLIAITAPKKEQKKRDFPIPDNLEKRWIDNLTGSWSKRKKSKITQPYEESIIVEQDNEEKTK